MCESVIFRVKQAIAEVLKISDPASISEHAFLKNELGLDSMSSLTFLMVLEDTIDGFIVDPETLEEKHLQSVATVSEYVTKQLERAA